MVLLRGFLERWDDARGFGFIYHVDYPKGIFIHISDFKRNISRRPLVGDIIVYELFTATNGKNKAINARIEGLAAATIKPRQTQRTVHRKRNNKKSSANLIKIILIALLAIVIFSVNKYQTIREARHSTPAVVEESITAPLVSPSSTQYSCQGKTYCSEMSSCEEAQFYQAHCSGTKMDGDGDGVPCEDQWCNH
jgi:cold shock CspA family protein